MPAAMTALATITLGSAASSVTFGSIPATYRDLRLVISGTSSTAAGVLWSFNGDTTDANYANVYMLGNGGSALSGSATSRSWSSIRGANLTQYEASVMDYSATDKHKSVLVRQSSAADSALAIAGRWANTAAVTSLAVSLGAATFSTGTTLSLYGILA
jgi:hypothetical protein